MKLCFIISHMRWFYVASNIFSCTGGADPKVECPVGKYNDQTSSDSISACLVCASGYYSSAGAASCTICPAGSACPDSDPGKAEI